ncbi:MAG: hypothetical protein OWS74_08710, partial [Firmicutes bacterium]|nr:hypothetical protein [Bacillota bacterium]
PLGKPTRKRQARWVISIGWIAKMWILAAVSSALAIQVIVSGYHVDALQNQLQSVSRQQQSLSLQLAQKTSVNAINRDAKKMHVTAKNIRYTPVIPVPSTPSSVQSKGLSPMKWLRDFSHGIQAISGAKLSR